MSKKRETENLPVRLTDDEVRSRGERMARLMGERDLLEDALAKAKLEHKAALEPIESELDMLARQVRTRTEDRAVEIVDRRNLDLAQMERYRIDTGELVSRRPLLTKEQGSDWVAEQELRQLDLDADIALGRAETPPDVPTLRDVIGKKRRRADGDGPNPA